MHFQPYTTTSQKVGYYSLRVLCGLILLFLVLPILVIVPLSFSSDSFLSYPLPGLSLRWYEEVLNSPAWTAAIKNSLIVGSASTLLATILGTLAAMGLNMCNFRGKAAMTAMMISPMVASFLQTTAGTMDVARAFFPEGREPKFVNAVLDHMAREARPEAF